jgi:hypothetical protein
LNWLKAWNIIGVCSTGFFNAVIWLSTPVIFSSFRRHVPLLKSLSSSITASRRYHSTTSLEQQSLLTQMENPQTGTKRERERERQNGVMIFIRLSCRSFQFRWIFATNYYQGCVERIEENGKPFLSFFLSFFSFFLNFFFILLYSWISKVM